jgi:quinol monooxygenase YgiN
MYHHVVTFRFKPEVEDAQVHRLARDLRAFASALPGLVSYACGTDLGLRQNNDDFAIAAVFDTEDALNAYLGHPDHQAIVATYVPTMVLDKHGAQFASV